MSDTMRAFQYGSERELFYYYRCKGGIIGMPPPPAPPAPETAVLGPNNN